MSDELDELEKSWDESKYDPNISLREMWDREEAYRRKKEEEDAKIKEKERKEQEERERERKIQEEQERIKRLNEAYQSQQNSSSSSYKPFSRNSGTSSDTIAPHSDSNSTVVYGPLTRGDVVFSLLGFFAVGCVVLSPILFLLFFKKIINAFSWMFSHWFCMLSGIAGFCLISLFIIYLVVFIMIARKDISKETKTYCFALYLLGGVIYFLVCRKMVQDGTKVFLAIFKALPVLFYFPAGVGLFIFLTSAVQDKTLWTFKSLKELFSFPVKVFAVWGILFLLASLFKGGEWAVSEAKTALLFYLNIFAAIVEWFIAPMMERLREML